MQKRVSLYHVVFLIALFSSFDWANADPCKQPLSSFSSLMVGGALFAIGGSIALHVDPIEEDQGPGGEPSRYFQTESELRAFSSPILSIQTNELGEVFFYFASASKFREILPQISVKNSNFNLDSQWVSGDEIRYPFDEKTKKNYLRRYHYGHYAESINRANAHVSPPMRVLKVNMSPLFEERHIRLLSSEVPHCAPESIDCVSSAYYWAWVSESPQVLELKNLIKVLHEKRNSIETVEKPSFGDLGFLGERHMFIHIHGDSPSNTWVFTTNGVGGIPRFQRLQEIFGIYEYVPGKDSLMYFNMWNDVQGYVFKNQN